MNEPLKNLILEKIPHAPKSVTSVEIKKYCDNNQLDLFTSNKHTSQMREIQRHFDKLIADYDMIEVTREGRSNHYFIPANKFHPSRNISSIVALQILEKEIISMLPPTMQHEMRQLFETMANHTNNKSKAKRINLWRNHFRYIPDFNPQPPHVNEAHFQAIENAMLKQCYLRVNYKTNKDNDTMQHEIAPTGVFSWHKNLYLSGWRKNRGDAKAPITLALHRITKIEIDHNSLSTPLCSKAFNQQISSNDFFAGGDKQRVTLRVNNKYQHRLLNESPLSTDQTIVDASDKQKPGHTIIKATVTHNNSFKTWLMKYCDSIEVIEPEELRQEIKDRLKTAVNLYNDY